VASKREADTHDDNASGRGERRSTATPANQSEPVRGYMSFFGSWSLTGHSSKCRRCRGGRTGRRRSKQATEEQRPRTSLDIRGGATAADPSDYPAVRSPADRRDPLHNASAVIRRRTCHDPLVTAQAAHCTFPTGIAGRSYDVPPLSGEVCQSAISSPPYPPPRPGGNAGTVRRLV
jgi:hypothetical protein